jgi:hypothetical protein
VADVSGQLIGPIFKGQVAQEEFLVSILITLEFEKVSLCFRDIVQTDRQLSSLSIHFMYFAQMMYNSNKFTPRHISTGAGG